MKHHHHIKKAYRGVSYALIALLGFMFISMIMHAQHQAAYMTEEARLMNAQAEAYRFYSGDVR